MTSRDFGFTTLRNITAYNTDNTPVTDNYILSVSSYGKQKWTNNLILNDISASSITTSSLYTNFISSNSIITSTLSTTAIFDASGNMGSAGQVLISDGSSVLWSMLNGTVPDGINWADYLYWDNTTSDWKVSTDRVRLLQNAGQTGQQSGAIAIGLTAGRTSQGNNSIAIGTSAGRTSQGMMGVSIGFGAGTTSQGQDAVAIGDGAGTNSQGQNTIAIGRIAGNISQGTNSIAIGNSAGQNSQHANSIILNAQGTTLNSGITSSFYVAPIRQVSNNDILQYNTTTKEITYNDSINISSISVSTINGISYPPSDDTFWSSDVSGNIYNDNSGNVGIGISTPQFKLDVLGEGHFSTSGGVILLNPDGTGGNEIRFGGGGPNADNLRFVGSGETERMRIDPNGNVGIGISTPQFKLDVSGITQISGGGANFRFGTSAVNEGFSMSWDTIQASGLAAQTELISGRGYSGNSESGGFDFFTDVSDNTDASGSNLAVRITGDKKVGINTATPAYALDVNGDVYSNAAFVVSTMLSDSAMRILTDSSNSYIQSGNSLAGGSANKLLFTNMDATSTAVTTIDLNNNRVGILNETPIFTLDVSGDVYSNASFVVSTSLSGGIMRMLNDNNKSYIQSGNSLSSGSGNKLLFTNIYASSTTPLTIDLSNNRLGILNESPQYELDINGVLRTDTVTMTNGQISGVSTINGLSYPPTNSLLFTSTFGPTLGNNYIISSLIANPNISGIVTLQITAQAGGGGGGGGGDFGTGGGGGGGGASGTSLSITSYIDSTSSINMVVGTGGSGGAGAPIASSGGNGTDGNNTYLSLSNQNAPIFCYGGKGGAGGVQAQGSNGGGGSFAGGGGGGGPGGTGGGTDGTSYSWPVTGISTAGGNGANGDNGINSALFNGGTGGAGFTVNGGGGGGGGGASLFANGGNGGGWDGVFPYLPAIPGSSGAGGGGGAGNYVLGAAASGSGAIGGDGFIKLEIFRY